MDIRAKKTGVFMGGLVNAGEEVTYALMCVLCCVV